MNKIDTIIDALENCSRFQPKNYYQIDKALAAAIKLKSELIKPKQEPCQCIDQFWCATYDKCKRNEII